MEGDINKYKNGTKTRWWSEKVRWD